MCLRSHPALPAIRASLTIAEHHLASWPSVIFRRNLVHPAQVIVERAAAVVGNLSMMEGNFQALREAGVMQRLVRLLEQGPQSRVTEIAAKTLATLAASDSNQTAVRLAGGIPPLMRLLTVRPTDQVHGVI